MVGGTKVSSTNSHFETYISVSLVDFGFVGSDMLGKIILNLEILGILGFGI
jgi:hypothetical protein